MNQASKIIYELNESTFEFIKLDAIKQAESNLLAKYADKQIDVKAAAQVLGISEDSVRHYANSGRLQPEQRAENGKLRFRLSHILSININQIKYKR